MTSDILVRSILTSFSKKNHNAAHVRDIIKRSPSFVNLYSRLWGVVEVMGNIINVSMTSDQNVRNYNFKDKNQILAQRPHVAYGDTYYYSREINYL